MKHAKLNASASHRWMECPPSVKYSEQFANESSSFANEGSFAHSVAENELGFRVGLISKDQYETKAKVQNSNECYSQNLCDYIDEYVAFIMGKITEAKSRDSAYIVKLEKRYSFADYVPEGFGTADVTIVAGDSLEIVDLKYGVGVPVYAYNNSQLRLYALGALQYFSFLYNIKTVKMTIAQVRLNSYTTEELTAEELRAWGLDYVKPRALLAYEGKGEFKSGSHCRFCPAKVKCKTRAEYNLELAKMDFAEPQVLSDEELGTILQRAEEIAAWVKDVKEYVTDQAINQAIKFPGWKLVRGKSKRAYIDAKVVEETLKKEGFNDNIYEPKTLKGITALEKIIGKKTFNKVLKGLIHKPEGKLTLVSENDPRPESNGVESAKADFDDFLLD